MKPIQPNDADSKALQKLVDVPEGPQVTSAMLAVFADHRAAGVLEATAWLRRKGIRLRTKAEREALEGAPVQRLIALRRTAQNLEKAADQIERGDAAEGDESAPSLPPSGHVEVGRTVGGEPVYAREGGR